MIVFVFLFSSLITTLWIVLHHHTNDSIEPEFNFSKLTDFNFSCGIRNLELNSRIMNGYSSRYHWPWIVSLRKHSQLFDTISGHYCAGIIINHRTILTAAHCVYEMKSSDIAVIVGLNNLNEKINSSNTYFANEAVYHQSFVSKTLENDIALILLNKNINFTESVSPICLPNIYANLSVILDKMMTLIGW